MMYELLCHKLVTVQIAATNAVANVANGERAQELLKECIPILIDRVKTSDNDVLINFSLRALANLALKDANQLLMTSVIGQLMALLSHPLPAVRLQSLKLLVNMSSNSSMVPYLLAAKVSERTVLKRHDSQHKCYIMYDIFTIMRNIEKLRHLLFLRLCRVFQVEQTLEIKLILF